MPWPLTHEELLSFPCRPVEIEDLMDGETPSVRRWRATFTAAS